MVDIKKKISTKKRLLSFYIILLIVVCILIFIVGLRVNSQDISRFVRKAGIWAPLVYILLFAITQIIAPLNGSPLFFAGYGLFNNKVQIYNYISTILSASIIFWISRTWGRNLVEKLVGKKDMNKVDQFTKDYGVKTLVFLRMFQGHLSDFISYAYGLTNMKFSHYFIITLFAPIPYVLLWQFFIFPRINNFAEFTFWFFITLIPLFATTWLFIKYKKKRVTIQNH